MCKIIFKSLLKSFKAFGFVDILIFCLIISYITANETFNALKYVLAEIMLYRSSMKLTFSGFLERIFFLSGKNILSLVWIDIFIVFFYFFSITLLLNGLDKFNGDYLVNGYILFAILTTGYFLRFSKKIALIKKANHRNFIRKSIFCISITIINFGMAYPYIGILLYLALFTMYILNNKRTLDYYDFF